MAGGALVLKLEHSGLLLVTPPLGLTALGGWLIYLPFCLVPSSDMPILEAAWTGYSQYHSPKFQHRPALT